MQMIHFPILKESLQQLHDIDPDMIPEGDTPESLIDVDKKVITMASMITDDNILRSVRTNQQEQSNEDDDNDGEVEDVNLSRKVDNRCYSKRSFV